MTILLVGPDFEENLSLRYLSSSLIAAGHTTILAPFNSPVDASAVVNAAVRRPHRLIDVLPGSRP